MPSGYRHLPNNDPEGFFIGMGEGNANYSDENNLLAKFAGGASLQDQLEKAWIDEDDAACYELDEALRIQLRRQNSPYSS